MRFGISSDNLIQTTNPVYSGEDITITNKTYSVRLFGLKGNATYYVQVMAINTANASMTSVETFDTLPIMEMESGKYQCMYTYKRMLRQEKYTLLL